MAPYQPIVSQPRDPSPKHVTKVPSKQSLEDYMPSGRISDNSIRTISDIKEELNRVPSKKSVK